MSALAGRLSWPGAFSFAWLAITVLTGLALFSLPINVLLLAAGAALFLALASITPTTVLVLLLVLAPFRALIATEAEWPLPLDIGQLLVLIWGCAWLFHHFVVANHRPRLIWPAPGSALTAFLIVAALSLGSSDSAAAWLREWLKWAGMLFVVILVANSAGPNAWRHALWGLLLAGAVNAMIGIYQFFGGSGALHLLINDRFFRAFGTFGQPNPFGGFMAMLLPLAACLLLAKARLLARNRGKSALAAAAITALATGLLLAGLVTSWSRGAWIASGAALLIMLLALPRQAWHGLLLAGATVLAVAMLWGAGLLPASLSARLASSTEDYLVWQDMRGARLDEGNYPVVERLAHWQAALNMAAERPWTGVGLGNYEHAYERYSLINWPDPLGHAHNFWLNQLAETGVPGLAVYVLMWGFIFRCTWRARIHPDPETRLVLVGLLGGWTSLAVHSAFDNLFVNNLFLHVGTMLGVLATLERQTSDFRTRPVQVRF